MKLKTALLCSLGLALLSTPAFASEKPGIREIEKANWLATQVNPLNPAELTTIAGAMWQLYARASGETTPSWPAIRPLLTEADRAAGSEPEDMTRGESGEAPPTFTMFLVGAGLVGMSLASTFKQRIG